MACPFFFPQQRMENPVWPHPRRLPLGDGFAGECNAPGHEGERPTDEELKDGCNLGYARHCARLPRERSCDAVRFSLARDRGQKLTVQFVCEIAYAPAGHGMLEFDMALQRWSSLHPDMRIQRMAECFLDSYLRQSGVARISETRDHGLETRATHSDGNQVD